MTDQVARGDDQRNAGDGCGWSYPVALLIMGVAGETLPGASAGRVVPIPVVELRHPILSPPLIA